ncbi:MAG: hypothetical protein ACSHYA_09555 [Opitutaceae bacterium]
MTPFFIEADRCDPMRAMMDEYGEVVRRLADEFGTHFVDTQRAFDRYLAERSSATLSEDRVHPNQIGHMILAKAFLQSVSYECKS